MTSTELPPWPDPAPRHGRVVLRPASDADVAMVRDLSTDPYIPTIGTIPLNATEEQAREWIAVQATRHAAGKGFSFCVADVHTDDAVGHCGLWLANLDKGRGTVGYSIAPTHRGQGLAADALIALREFAWTVPGLHRIEAYVEPENVASQRTAERAGFQREGIARSFLEIAGTRRDVVVYATIREDSLPTG